MPPPKIHSHLLTGPNGDKIISQALKVLRPYLPSCIPLYRRLQFGRFFPETRILTSLPNLEVEKGKQWLIAFVDRTCRPETEVWMFGSWEHAQTPSPTVEQDKEQDTLIYALFKTIASLPIPTSLHQDLLNKLDNDAETDHSGLSRTDYSAHMLNSDVILCGGIHSASIPSLQRTGLIKHVFAAGLVPNHEYLFNLDEPPLSDLLATGLDLPEGLRWGELKYSHFALVRSRTQIPRQDRTLAVLPNVGIFPSTQEDPEPVAWAFVGLDGSLTTLHVEPEWRGKGLGKLITTKLFKDKMGMFWEKGTPRIAHDYVIKGNVASVGVSERLGGKSEWDAFWVRVDLGLVGG